MTKFFTVGNTIRVSGRFKDDAGEYVDPDIVTFTFRKPEELTTTSYVYVTDDEVVKTDTGHYHVDLVPAPDEPGNWRYRWAGTGLNAAADEGEFVIEASAV